VRDLRTVLDQARRARLELSAISGLGARLSDTGATGARDQIDTSLEESATALGAIATALRHARRPTTAPSPAAPRRDALLPIDGLLEGGDPDALIARQCASHLAALAGQIRAAGSLVDTARSDDGRRAWRPSVPSPRRPDLSWLGNDVAILRANLRSDSPALRHAVRLAIAVPASALVASWLSLPRGYWVPLAVALILKPDYSTLLGRGVGRMIGTLLGAVLAALLLGALHPDPFLTTALVAVTAWAAYTTWAASFPAATGFITALVLILLSTALTDNVGTALDRLVDIALGGAIALVTYLVWPTSPRAKVVEAHSALLTSLRDYLAAVLAVVEGQPVEAERLSACSRATRIAWAGAEAAVGRSIHEPATTRIDPSEGRGVVAAALRIVRATDALRTDAERGATVAGFAELDSLATGLRDTLDALSEHASYGRPGPMPDLRALYRAAEQPLVALGAPPSIGLHLDELVNATNTVAHLTGLIAPR